MELIGVRIELPSNAPIVLLRETDGEGRLLPIFIGGAEAQAAGHTVAPDEAEGEEPPAEEVLDQFREFLDQVTPEDFNG